MSDQDWPPEIWVTPASDGVTASVSILEYGPKAFLRIWPDGTTEHSWVLHETAVRVWPAAGDEQ